MSLRSHLGAFLILSAALSGAGAGILMVSPSQRIEVSTLEIDGHPVPSAGQALASSRPRVMATLSHPIPSGLWSVAVDGRRLPIPSGDRSLGRLAIAVPDAFQPGSRHLLEVAAGPARRRAPFTVIRPLEAAISTRLHDLQAAATVNLLTTVQFSRPVKDRVLAEDLIEVPGEASGFRWVDPRTVQVTSSGIPLGAHVSASVDDGILDVAGSWTTVTRTAEITVPAQITQLTPGRLANLYYVNTPDAHAALFAHLDQIDMLSPNWYVANADGSLTASAYQDVIDAVHAHRVQIVPLIQNAGVDPNVAHAILADPARRLGFAARLVQEAKTYGYAGFQLDFEQVRWSDRDLLTALVQDSAAALHAAGLSLSVAVIPRLDGDATSTGDRLDYYHTWSGAYDFPALARAADFLAFMTYDEHNGLTGPGSVAGRPWMRQALDYSLQGVPPGKATLGVPTYYHDWDRAGNLSSSSIDDAMTLAAESGATPVFDPVEDEMHLSYTLYGVHHELWYESGDTISRKLPLIYEYGLRGISVWRLGFEDSSFWNLIPARR